MRRHIMDVFKPLHAVVDTFLVYRLERSPRGLCPGQDLKQELSGFSPVAGYPARADA